MTNVDDHGPTHSERTHVSNAAPALTEPLRPALQQAFLDCHSDGHQWKHLRGTVDPSDAESGLGPPWGMQTAVGRRSTCTSCKCERIRWYTRSGEVVSRYRYQDGYLHKRATEDDWAPTRQEWRARLVEVLFAEFTQAVNGAPRKRAAT